MRGWGAHEVRLIVVESVVASIELARQAIHLLAVCGMGTGGVCV